MFDSRSFHAAGPTGEIRDDLAFKIAAQFSSKKVHDFLGAKAQGAVAEQFRIEFGKMLTAFKQDVGRRSVSSMTATATGFPRRLAVSRPIISSMIAIPPDSLRLWRRSSMAKSS